MARQQHDDGCLDAACAWQKLLSKASCRKPCSRAPPKPSRCCAQLQRFSIFAWLFVKPGVEGRPGRFRCRYRLQLHRNFNREPRRHFVTNQSKLRPILQGAALGSYFRNRQTTSASPPCCPRARALRGNRTFLAGLTFAHYRKPDTVVWNEDSPRHAAEASVRGAACSLFENYRFLANLHQFWTSCPRA